MRILFCGDCFPASQSLLKERLPIGEDEIVVCNGINLRKALANCNVVIPMMTILDEAVMEAGIGPMKFTSGSAFIFPSWCGANSSCMPAG